MMLQYEEKVQLSQYLLNLSAYSLCLFPVLILLESLHDPQGVEVGISAFIFSDTL